MLSWLIVPTVAIVLTVRWTERAWSALLRRESRGAIGMELKQPSARRRYTDSGARAHLVGTASRICAADMEKMVELECENFAMRLRIAQGWRPLPWSKASAAGAGMLVVLGAWTRARSRHRALLSLPRCFRCRYDLASINAKEAFVICPECGERHKVVLPKVTPV